MKEYTVAYRMSAFGEQREIKVEAANKADAYDRATYEAIPEHEGETPYSAWLVSVAYKNGRIQEFNNIEGDAY